MGALAEARLSRGGAALCANCPAHEPAVSLHRGADARDAGGGSAREAAIEGAAPTDSSVREVKIFEGGHLSKER